MRRQRDANGRIIVLNDDAKGKTRKGKKLEGRIIAVSQTHPKVMLHDLHKCVSMWLHPSNVIVTTVIDDAPVEVGE